jgi:2-oxoglutarate ferredoxin oxidoreductase subunit alpha
VGYCERCYLSCGDGYRALFLLVLATLVFWQLDAFVSSTSLVLNLVWRYMMQKSIRIAGAAGQGIQTCADLLGKIATRSGLFAYCYTDSESRIRGGLNFSQVCVATEPVSAVDDSVDVLVALTQQAADSYSGSLTASGLLIDPKFTQLEVDLHALAKEAGSGKSISTVSLAVVCALLGLDQEEVRKAVAERFDPQRQAGQISQAALALTFSRMAEVEPGARFSMPLPRSRSDRLWLAGHQALSLGAVAGGVTFVAGYPMSPATSVLTDLAAWCREAGVVVEQAEDEVAAINMVAGASYAGARSMTATSGGGFCLMTEGVSLLGMIESPAVVVVAQRPGPATGLPTRTAQGDIQLVLQAGHGSFPRIILAPADIPACFELCARAFDLAERFQVPVFILTDQLLQDSQITCSAFDVKGFPTQRHRLSRDELAALSVYRRYEDSETGISPLAAPGESKHLVVVDSDEHDQVGHLNETAEMAGHMARRRLAKTKTVAAQEFFPLALDQDCAGRDVVIAWGSTTQTLAAALGDLPKELRPVPLTLTQLWPLPVARLKELLTQARRCVVVENNITGQLADLLQHETLIPLALRINKMDGRPFTRTQLKERLLEVLS